MLIVRTVLVSMIAVFALVLTTGCQQKAPAGKSQESVLKRAEESNKIIKEAGQRVRDSLKEAKNQAGK
jgi:hypothetical protein